MLQKTKLTLLRLFAIVAFIALFVVASFSLASCSSDEKYVVSVTKNDSGVLVVTYSDGTTSELGVVDGEDGEDGDDGVSIKEITYSNGSLIITYNDAAATQEIVDISNLIESNACDHSNSTYLDLSGYTEGVIRETTCTETGLTIKYCLDCGNVFVDETAMLPHTLDYSTGTWKLSEDYTTATVTAVCSVCQQEISESTTDVTSTTNKEATCHDAGEVEYTAKITIDGQEYTHTETAVVPATGLHKYVAEDGTEYTVQMKTVGGNTYVYIDGSETAADYDRLVEVFGEANVYMANCTAGATLPTQNLVCANEGCGEHIYGYADPVGHIESDTPVVENVVAATCTEEGSYDNVYYCTRCGQVVRTEKVTIDKLDHSYVTDATDDANWTWTPVYDTDNTTVLTYTATLTFTCEHCGDTMTQDAVITRVYTEQSCQEAESYTYTATVTYNEVPYIGTYYDELDSTYVIGYHTTNTGFTYVLDSNHFIYAYDTVTGTASTTPLTVSEFLALGGEMTSYGGTNELSYGRITCTTCYNLTGAAAGTDVLNNVTLPEGGHDYANVTDSDVVWTWSGDYTTATATITCDYCGESTDYEATVTTEANANGNGTIYTATVTYGLYSWSASVEFLTATAGTEQALTLSSTATSASYEVAATATGPYAIEFSSTEAYIVVTSLYGTYTSYSAPAAVSTLSAKPLEEVATVNYLLDSDGNIAIVPQDAVIYIDVYLYDTTTAAEVSAAFTVTGQAIPTVTVGTAYTVTMGAELYSLTTSVTITEAGYYTITATDGAYITVWDDAYTCYYSTRWVEWGYITLGYIVDYAEYDEVPISIPANTTLNVAITYSSDDLTAITVLIAKGDYTPETSGGDDEDTYDYTLTSEGLEAALAGGESAYSPATYTVYVSEAGNYTFAVDANGDIVVEVNGNNAESVYSDSPVTYELAVGDVVTISAYAASTVTIAVEIKTTTIAHGGESDATADAGTYYVWYIGDYEWWSEWAPVENTDSVATLAENGTITWVVANNDINGATWYANQLFYENADLTEGTSYDLSITVVATAAGSITINGKVVTLVADEAQTLTINYTEGSTASLSIQLGVDGVGADLGACTITFSNISWAEHKEPTTVLAVGENIINPETDVTFTSEEGGTYKITISGDDVDYANVWAGEEEYNSWTSTALLDVQCETYSFTVTLEAGETITLYVAGSEKVVTLTIAPSEDSGDQGEVITTNVPTLVVGENTITLSEADATDGYTTSVTLAAGTYTFEVTGDGYVEVGEYGARVYINDEGTPVTQEYTLEEAGAIKIVVYTYSMAAGTYTLKITNTEPEDSSSVAAVNFTRLDSTYGNTTGDSADDPYMFFWVTSTINLETEASSVTLNGTAITWTLYSVDDPVDGVYSIAFRVLVGAENNALSSYEFVWYDADGNKVAQGTYTVATTYTVTYAVNSAYTTDGEEDRWTVTYADNATDTSDAITVTDTLSSAVKEREKSTNETTATTLSYYYEIKGASNSAAAKALAITVAEDATDVTLTVYVSHTSSSSTRTVLIATTNTATSADDESVVASLAIGGTDGASTSYLYAITVTLTAGNTYYIYSDSSDNTCHIYEAVITYTV